MEKLSQWHDQKIRPLKKGWYQCRNFKPHSPYDSADTEWMCEWRGKDWYIDSARGMIKAYCQDIYWRGIAK